MVREALRSPIADRASTQDEPPPGAEPFAALRRRPFGLDAEERGRLDQHACLFEGLANRRLTNVFSCLEAARGRVPALAVLALAHHEDAPLVLDDHEHEEGRRDAGSRHGWGPPSP